MGNVVTVLNVTAFLCALYITWKAYQDSFKWGLFFFLSPVIYYVGARYVGAIIAGCVIIGLQLWYVKNNWKTVGAPFVVMTLAWVGATFLPR